MTRFCVLGGRLALLAGVLLVLGCGAVVPPGDGDGDGVDDDIVLLAFRNLSEVNAVEVNFYASTEPLENLPDDLFVEANLIRAGIGVAGTGIIEPLEFDFLDNFACSEDLIVGTSGGRFLDNDTGEEIGDGQPRWVTAAALGFCGRSVAFTFSGNEGDFKTEISIAP